MFATAGNLSVRDPSSGGVFWITASGKHKGELSANDFLPIHVSDGSVQKEILGLKPSAETSIHQSIYQCNSDANAALHVHTLDSNLLDFGLTPDQPVKEVDIPPIEIIKAFGIWEERPKLTMPVFYNFGSVPKIANEIKNYFQTRGLPKVPFLLIEGHGPTVWGDSIPSANRHLEAVSFLFQVMARLGR